MNDVFEHYEKANKLSKVMYNILEESFNVTIDE